MFVTYRKSDCLGKWKLNNNSTIQNSTPNFLTLDSVDIIVLCQGVVLFNFCIYLFVGITTVEPSLPFLEDWIWTVLVQSVFSFSKIKSKFAYILILLMKHFRWASNAVNKSSQKINSLELTVAASMKVCECNY